MSGPVEQVHWSAVERDARRSAVWAIVGFVAFFVSLALLTGGFAFWEGRAAWIAVGLFVAVGVVLQVVVVLRSRTSERAARNLRFRYALLHRVDPGPGVREKVDVAARQLSTVGWLWWVFPLTPVSFLFRAGGTAPWWPCLPPSSSSARSSPSSLWWRRSAAAARRWVADPPGPDRARTAAEPARALGLRASPGLGVRRRLRARRPRIPRRGPPPGRLTVDDGGRRRCLLLGRTDQPGRHRSLGDRRKPPGARTRR